LIDDENSTTGTGKEEATIQGQRERVLG